MRKTRRENFRAGWRHAALAATGFWPVLALGCNGPTPRPADENHGAWVVRPETRPAPPIPLPQSVPSPPPATTSAPAQAELTTATGAPSPEVQSVPDLRANLDAARERDDSAGIVRAAYALGVKLIVTGDAEAARGVLAEAEGEASRSRAMAAEVLLLEAQLARERDDAPAALVYADRVLTESQPSEAQQAQVNLIRGEVAADLGQWDLARRELNSASFRLGDGGGGGPSARADFVGLSARIAMSDGEAARAASQYDLQADLLRQSGRYRDMSRALAHSAAAYAQADQPAPAADRYYRAARSAAARGDNAEAIRLLTSAGDQADRAHDEPRLSLIRALQQHLPPTTRPATVPSP